MLFSIKKHKKTFARWRSYNSIIYLGYSILLEVHNFRMEIIICNSYFTVAEVEFRRWWAYSRNEGGGTGVCPGTSKSMLLEAWLLNELFFLSLSPVRLSLRIICWGSWVSSEDPMPCWLCQWLLRNSDQRLRLVPSKLRPPANPAPQANER